MTPMGPMIGVMVSQEMLMAHQCQAMAHFELWVVSKSSDQETKNPEPKLTLFSAMTPYQLLPNSFISHLWDQ
jgi:hypothetical protein